MILYKLLVTTELLRSQLSPPFFSQPVLLFVPYHFALLAIYNILWQG
jgi:hypothetical protein